MNDERKRQAAHAALAFIEPGTIVGVGTGSTTNHFIDALPGAYRSVFVLRAVEEYSVEETAAILEIPEATVRTRFFRARSLLREGLASEADLAVQDAFGFAGERCDRIVATVMDRIARETPR